VRPFSQQENRCRRKNTSPLSQAALSGRCFMSGQRPGLAKDQVSRELFLLGGARVRSLTAFVASAHRL